MCKFCDLILNKQYDYESKYCVAFKDCYPVSKGHTLIITKRHVDNLFLMTEKEQLDMLKLMNIIKCDLDYENNPDGYNVGFNCGESSGQTVMHVHMHLIPRYKGDTLNPRGGVRGVIPDKQNYKSK